MRAHEVILIPLDVVQFVLSKKLVKPFKTFMYLKITYGGYFNVDDCTHSDLNQVGIKHKRTLKAHLQKLEAINFIRSHPETDTIYIRSFRYLSSVIKYYSKDSVIFCSTDLKKIKSFLCASFIVKLILGQIKNGRARKKARAYQRPLSQYSSISTIGIAKILMCSLSTAHQIKQESIKYGYVKKLKTHSLIPGLQPALIPDFCKLQDIEPGLFKVSSGKVLISDIDRFKNANLKIKKHKRLSGKKTKHISSIDNTMNNR